MNNSTSPIVYYPFYYSSSPQVLSFVSDKTLSLFLPIICYWLFSLFFIALDYLSPRYPYLMKHKIHTEPDPNPNNLVGHAEVVSKVLLQQALQVVVSLLAVKDGDIGFWPADHRKGMQLIQPYLLKAMQLVLGTKTGFHVFSDHRERLLSFTYWWGIPVLQFFLAM
jgi:sphinganine C4-monooxygenase